MYKRNRKCGRSASQVFQRPSKVQENYTFWLLGPADCANRLQLIIFASDKLDANTDQFKFGCRAANTAHLAAHCKKGTGTNIILSPKHRKYFHTKFKKWTLEVTLFWGRAPLAPLVAPLAL